MRKNIAHLLSFAWVKNVYSLRTDSGTKSGYTRFSYTPPTMALSGIGVQVPRFTQVSTMLSASLSTVLLSYLPLLNTDLYPLSTAPTIKKKKGNKERNS